MILSIWWVNPKMQLFTFFVKTRAYVTVFQKYCIFAIINVLGFLWCLLTLTPVIKVSSSQPREIAQPHQ